MYLVEVQLEFVYIPSKGQWNTQFSCHKQNGRASANAGACAECVRAVLKSLLLPLTIVSECAGKLTAYLCRVAEGPTSDIGAVQVPSPD